MMIIAGSHAAKAVPAPIRLDRSPDQRYRCEAASALNWALRRRLLPLCGAVRPGRSRNLVPLGEKAVSDRRLQALLYLIANEAELIHLVAAVEPLPALASSRHDLLIPLLPGSQSLRWHAKHAGYCSDGVNPIGAVSVALHPWEPFHVMSVNLKLNEVARILVNSRTLPKY
jgi:hypothetical protein